MLESKRNLWRENAVNFTERYLNEGIPDRCASRTLNYGIDIPIEGFKDKKLYGWFENVWGYEYYGGARTVDVHIKSVREKLSSPNNKWEIKNTQ